MIQRRVGRAAVLLVAATAALAATTVVVNSTASHAIPSTLYGQMFEDINSGDGGLYAELLQNRAFQQVTPGDATALYAWAAVNGGNITVIADSDPVSSALPNALQLTIPSGASGSVGFGNEGYYGINVNSSWTYNASFYYRFPEVSDFSGDATVALQSASGEIYASAQIPVSGSQTTWTQVYAQLTPSTSPSSTANNFTVTFDSSAAGNTINFAMFLLFPPTFKDRANGMRIDVAEVLYSMKPSFFRLPGGNNLEGQSAATRWIWNNTVGDLVDRPGRVGDWSYINTDGLGLLEYLYWCEDMEMEPFMAVWAGYSLDGTSLPEDELAPYIQAAIDQINFVTGDPSGSSAAALRASLGREEPFSLTYVEIGNEDFVASESYIYRWRDFAGNLTAAFPQLKFIATTDPFNPILDPTPQQYDNHVYSSPDWFAENSFYYDDFERNCTYYFQGEYAVTYADENLMYPTIQGSIGEAAYMTGFERNADIVFAASYAPLLMNVADGAYQWIPNLVEFDAANVYKSTSFYVQHLNRGTEYLPSTLPDPSGTVFWSVTSDSSTLAIKVVNYANTTEDVTFQLPFAVASSATVTVLTGDSTASNTPTDPNLVTPTTSAITIGQAFNYTAPAYSLSVINVSLS
ncbi:glycoside hydrolase family 51 protein [Coniophora puteana RWD-64-598 SS2]|uniref:non-reducing end alpha-L-arabinofuranosidase n=1 Tax=Coniophora puteana (strain RWD-64-598) TaxID=741705 RepID=A0A5M3MCD8_CONPW|nr:glycoside hydrolase family 51 protein [Coniophora puteana RWD-64-598 SS2]EIW76868.1 glycoside hydrolase family 51 protein [Coniophora puteana RWD-64-598 SS2]